MMQTRLDIDGSYGEGGGQLLRGAVALAAVTGRPVRVRHIRAGRARPGLAPQHLTAVRAVASLCAAECRGLAPGADTLEFRPAAIAGGDYHFEVGTAGSVTLVLQAVLPVMLHAPRPCNVGITGGTDVRQAPPLDYVLHVLVPRLRALGCRVQVQARRRGYYPRGGGHIEVATEPSRVTPPRAFGTAPQRTVAGIAHAAHLPTHIPQRMVAAASAVLAQRGLNAGNLTWRCLPAEDAAGPGGAIVLWTTDDGPVLGAGLVAERGVPAEALGASVASELADDVAAGATVDRHAADQLVIYMALAQEAGSFVARELSLHAHTAIWLAEHFLPVRFDVQPARDRVTVRCVPYQA